MATLALWLLLAFGAGVGVGGFVAAGAMAKFLMVILRHFDGESWDDPDGGIEISGLPKAELLEFPKPKRGGK